jgi:signal recognition particle subunit SRP19
MNQTCQNPVPTDGCHNILNRFMVANTQQHSQQALKKKETTNPFVRNLYIHIMSTTSNSSSSSGSKRDPLLPSETDNVKSWQCIYPIYLDSTKTVSQGRRISKSKCVESPTAKEIYDICRHLKIKCYLEMDKRYSRDSWIQGRVKVLFRTHEDNNKETYHAETEYKSKRQLYETIASLIPRLESRIKNMERQREEKQKEEQKRLTKQQQQQQQQQQQSGKRSSGKKGGKKGGKRG